MQVNHANGLWKWNTASKKVEKDNYTLVYFWGVDETLVEKQMIQLNSSLLHKLNKNLKFV